MNRRNFLRGVAAAPIVAQLPSPTSAFPQSVAMPGVASDALALGTSSARFADLFLVTPGVINFESGDAVWTVGGKN